MFLLSVELCEILGSEQRTYLDNGLEFRHLHNKVGVFLPKRKSVLPTYILHNNFYT